MTEVKICGITTENEARFIKEISPDYMGVVLFFPKSKRNMDIEAAKNIIKAAGENVKKVAVTVSPTLEQAMLISEAGFDFIQIHGEMFDDVLNNVTLPIIRAFNDKNLDEVDTFVADNRIYAFLFDAAEPGSGKTFDWNKLIDIKKRINNKKIFLAGGLTPENVKAAISAVPVDAVDVSSGVENDNGYGKDLSKIERFINNVRN